MKKILVTGGCGFVGSNLVAKLVEQGHQVSVLDNLSRGRRDYLSGFEQVRIIEADIREPEACAPAFEDIDTVVHLAAYGSVVESVDDPVTNFEINVVGTFNILNLCVKHNVSRLVFSSTGGALIGDASPPVSEQSLPKPISPYGASKLCCEAYCHAYAKSFGLRAICLRFANVYGPNSYHKTGVINKFFHAVKEDQPLIVYGDGSSSRDYVHVSDLTDGIVLALNADNIDEDVIHIAGGREVQLAELARVVKSVSGKVNHPIENRASRKGEVDRNFADYSYAAKILGYAPKYTLEQGIQELWDNYDWNA